MMVLTGQSANLISIGAIDFGILVDASIVVLESIYRKLSRRTEDEKTTSSSSKAKQRAKPGCLPLHHPRGIHPLSHAGVPGKIFAPMSVTYGFALTGALIFALIFAPVLAYLVVPTKQNRRKHETPLGGFLSAAMTRPSHVLRHRGLTWL